MADSSSSSDIQSEIDEENNKDIFGFAMQLVNRSVLPMALNAAIQLGVFDILANARYKTPLSAKQIAARIPTDNPNAPAMLERICRLLVDQGVLCRYSRTLYCLTPVSKYFLHSEDGVSLVPLMTLIQDLVFFESWFKLKDAVLEGEVPFNKLHGMNFYEYLGRDDRFSKVFYKAMFNQTPILLENVDKVVDVGGGTGVTLSSIISQYPDIEGINFDLPHVIQHAPTFPGVKHVAGDMFESVPEGDAILLKGILHDWSDDHCLILLENCYNALPINGKLMVVECKNYDGLIFQIDELMMTRNTGGKKRTGDEISGLATRARFKKVGFSLSVLNNLVMEFKK